MLKKLFRFEFRKLFYQKSFYMCIVAMLGMSILSLLLTRLIINNATPENPVQIPSMLDLMLTSINASNFTLISGIFVVLFVCADYNQETIKNIFARGYSSLLVYITKYIVCIVAMLIMLIISTVFTLLLGGMMFNGEEQLGNYVGLFFGQIVYCITSATFAFMMGYISKKVGSSIALFILGPGIINLAISLVDALIGIETFKLVNYWFSNFSAELTTLATSTERLIVCLIFSIIYTVMFVGIGYLFNKKKEK